MSRAVAYLFVPLGLYVALVAQTALRFGGAGPWTPNLLLLAGLIASRGRGGVLWAATAGLVCDAASGRPLGVTMLAATLAAAVVARRGASPAGASPLRAALGTFLTVAVVEAVARVLAATVSAEPNLNAQFLAAVRVAFATGLVACGASLALQGAGLLRRSVRRVCGAGSLAPAGPRW